MLFYNTVLKPGQSLFKDSGSKHFGFSYHCKSLREAKDIIESLRAEHPKANHVCFAYRILVDQGEVSFSSDDGEPKNSAGPPILGQILSNNLHNVLIAVVRYFGGTKLGVPGLINAYKTAAQETLNDDKIGTVEIEQNILLSVDYAKYHVVKDILAKIDHKLVKEDHTSKGATMNISLKKALVENAIQWLRPHASSFEVEK